MTGARTGTAVQSSHRALRGRQAVSPRSCCWVLLLWATGGIDPHRQFFLSYLVAYNYWLGGALGCLVFLMLQYVTGGAWGLILRRILEAAAGTLPLLAVLLLPVLCGLPFVSEYTQWHPVHGRAKNCVLQGRLAQRALRPRPGGHLLRLLDRLHGKRYSRGWSRSSRTTGPMAACSGCCGAAGARPASWCTP